MRISFCAKKLKSLALSFNALKCRFHIAALAFMLSGCGCSVNDYMDLKFGEIVLVEGEFSPEYNLTIYSLNNSPLNRSIVTPVTLAPGIKFKPNENIYNRRLVFLGYKSGGYSGLPNRAFIYVPQVAISNFKWHDEFEILKWKEKSSEVVEISEFEIKEDEE